MPNHITTIIVPNTKDQHDELMHLLVNEKNDVDFNLIIPIPSPLIMAQYPLIAYIIDGLACLSVLKTQKEIDRIIETLTRYNNKRQQPFENGETYFKPIDLITVYTNAFKRYTIEYNHRALTPEAYKDRHKKAFENETLVERCYQNISLYGHPYALDWCNEHWGTSLNAYQTNFAGKHIAFQTANKPPVKLLNALYKRHQADFTAYWFDEQVQTGRVDLLDADEIEETEDYIASAHLRWHKDIGLIDDAKHFGKLVMKKGKVENKKINVRAEKALLKLMLEDE